MDVFLKTINPVTLHSIFNRRLLILLAVFSILTSAIALFSYQKYTIKRNHEALDETIAHMLPRIQEQEDRRNQNADRLLNIIDWSGIVRLPQPLRSEKLTAFFTAQSETLGFEGILITDPASSTPVFDYWAHAEKPHHLEAITGDQPLWFDQDHAVLYTRIKKAIRSDQGILNIIFFRAWDSEALKRISFPDTTAYIFLGERPILSSEGNLALAAKQATSLAYTTYFINNKEYQETSVAWTKVDIVGSDQAVSALKQLPLRIAVDAPVKNALPLQDVLIALIGIILLFGLLIFFIFGRWLSRIGTRLDNLTKAALAFQNAPKLICSNDPQRLLNLANGTYHDQISVIAQELSTLMKASKDRDKEHQTYLQTLDLMHDAVVEFSPDGRLIRATDAWKTLAGKDELTDSNILDSVHPEDRAQVLEQITALIEEKNQQINLNIRLLRLNDPEAVFWVEARLATVKEDGKAVGIRGIIRDITTLYLHKAAGDTARYTRSLIEASLDPLVTISAEGKITDVNTATEEVTGVSRSQLIGSDFAVYFTDPAKARAGYLEVFSQGFVTDYPLVIRHVSGSITEVLYNASLYRDDAGKVQGVFAAARNISARKQMEDALRNSHETLHSILETTRDGYFSVSSEGNLIDANTTYCRLSGYTRDELLQLKIFDLEAIENNKDTAKHIQHIIKNGSDQFESVHRRKDGSTWHLEASITYHDFEGGRFFVFVRDITERKQIAAELEKHRDNQENLVIARTRELEEARDHLEEVVAQRTVELREALESARLADKAKDEFLANVTHELRTPLSAVIGMAGLARAISTEPRQRDYLDKITIAGKHLNGIINDLLDLSKIVAGYLEFENLTFSLRNLILQVRSVMFHRAAENGLELTESIHEAVPDVLLGDALRLKQILLNLVGNAVKFTPNGRVDIRVSLAAREENRICLDIAVEDSGIGMSAEDMERLFKPFTQADSAVSRKFGGTGLGLTISRQLAEMMGGNISVVSREGQGTTFLVKVWLGLGDPANLPQVEAVGQEFMHLRYHNARVLVVDDQPFNRDIVQGLLAVVGITPQLAENGQEALDLLADNTHPYDLVLMDIQMPVLDGITATRVIRGDDRFTTLPIIAMTAHTIAHEKEKSAAAGMNDHIGKPFDETSFYRILAKWIPESKQQPLVVSAPPVAASNPVCGIPPLAGVDLQTGLNLLQKDEARYRHWLGVFVKETPATLKQIRQALAAGQTESASMSAHTLKGRTGLLGMKALHSKAALLETALVAAQPADELLLDLEQDVAAMCAEIILGLDLDITPEIIRETLPVKPPDGPTPACIVQLLARLQAGDSDCDRLVTACLAELKDTAWAAHLQQAQQRIDNFDYAAASSILTHPPQQPQARG
jgi:PAS domain S-box-containing protein